MSSQATAIEREYPNLYHYSKKPLARVESRDPSEEGCGYAKPAGFWVSVDDDFGWPQWCKGEEYCDDLGIRHHIALAEPQRLLWICTEDDLDLFDETFGEDTRYRSREIIWPLVADQFAGVVITPYQWSRRLEIGWYYGWDCASGIIWDASVIGKITVLGEQK